MEDTTTTPSTQYQQDNNEVTIPSRWLELARQTPMAGPGAFVGVPGAYSAAPGPQVAPNDQLSYELLQRQQQSALPPRLSSRSIGNDDSGLLEARKVVDESATREREEAEPVDEEEARRRSSARRAQGDRKIDRGATVDSDAKSIETISPTQDLLALLDPPDYTVSTLMKDENSTQAKAYEWLLEDQMLGGNYTQERLRQRFALATFFYATNGLGWNQTDRWLSHERHECEWMSLNLQPVLTDHFLYDFPTVDVCDRNDNIQILAQQENELQGTIPLELFWGLPSLQRLHLESNPGLVGTIPTEIGMLSNLQELALIWSSFTRTIPVQVFQLPSLKTLVLGALAKYGEHKFITGTLPATAIGGMTCEL
ncbi:unknown protein [Seminavis robusta]|uniref:Uncharacterized protein n=1 Tax=Seminavis robusta TaxID=568900 RepID=A0A9N8DT73_9STRA|nr:unknown protein [Seminavis robusta]|eukprot:Sro334_g119690.1 n/a (368) ;mRNA; r:2837-4049